MVKGFLPDTDSEDELPPGWEEQTTAESRVYYIEPQSKRTQFHHPRSGRLKHVTGELPMGWEQSIDNETNRQIYINSETKQSTFVDPRLAFAVEESQMKASEVRQHFNASTTAFQVLHGRDLHGKLCVITGANCGIGFETARSLALDVR